MYEYFYRPDIIFSRFFAKELPVQGHAAHHPSLDAILNKGLPPKVSIKMPYPKITEDKVTIRVKLTDAGGGIGRVLYRANGVTQGEDLFEREAGATDGLEIKKTLSIASGENIIQVSAFNKSNGIESKPVQVKVIRKAVEVQKPDLYILAIGINQYRDHALELLYPVNDAKDLVDVIREHGTGLYRNINVESVLDQDATREHIKNAFKKIVGKIHPDDVFVLYLAGHGFKYIKYRW